MRTIDGQIRIDIYTTEDGYVALKQMSQVEGADSLCLLSVDQIPGVIRELQALYANRQSWADAMPE
jgi:hypothetical protein